MELIITNRSRAYPKRRGSQEARSENRVKKDGLREKVLTDGKINQYSVLKV